MVTMEALKEKMKLKLENDSQRRFINVTSDTVYEGLSEAAIEFSLPIAKLEYEILERGSKGIAGRGKKPYLLLIYPSTQSHTEEQEAHEQSKVSTISQRDGQVYVRLAPHKIMLKVTKPNSKGNRATLEMAKSVISQRTQCEVNMDIVRKVVVEAAGEFRKIGEYSYNPANSATIAAYINDDHMSATMVVSSPGLGGSDPSVEELVAHLKSIGIIEGFDMGVLEEFMHHPQYGRTLVAAKGRQAEKGSAARIQYNFKQATEKSRVRIVGDKVDFKELHLVQNVVKGQVLAQKHPAEPGVDGVTVTGKILPAEDGADVTLKIGKNVEVSEDGLFFRSKINGQVILENNVIRVEPIYMVNGDVNLKTGNIEFLGAVVIRGNVNDGFTVRASGSIEVTGIVGKAILDTEDNIIVRRGIAGKGEAKIRCGKNIWAKFIENSTVIADGLVIVSDGIINSDVSSLESIICNGARAAIVGGTVKAVKGINAKTLGSVAGTETMVEVAVDPFLKKERMELTSQLSRLKENHNEIILNIKAYTKAKAGNKTISSSRQKYYDEIIAQEPELAEEIKVITQRIEEIGAKLMTVDDNVSISVQGIVHPGVHIGIKDASFVVRNEFRHISFVLRDSVVKIEQYKEFK